MSVLVTGATGFIGSQLVQALARTGEEVVALSRSRPPAADVRWIPFDSASPTSGLEPELARASAVYHLAWSTVPSSADRDPSGDVRVNVAGSLRLMQLIAQASDARLIFASSGGTVYGDAGPGRIGEETSLAPLSAYGLAKATVEAYLAIFARQRGLDYTTVRLANPYGPGQSGDKAFGAVATFAKLTLDGAPISLFGDGGVVRDYIFIDDVISALLACRRPEASGEIFNVGSGEGRSLIDVIDAVSSACGARPDVLHSPGRAFDVRSNVLDVSKIKRTLKWEPTTPFAYGVRRYVESLRGR